MTYVMTKPCPVCKQQLTKRRPTDDAALLPSFSLEPRAAGAEPAGLIGS
jgi:hypothetical protein